MDGGGAWGWYSALENSSGQVIIIIGRVTGKRWQEGELLLILFAFL